MNDFNFFLLFLGGEIFAVCGPEPFGIVTGRKTQGFVIGLSDGQIRSTFNGGGSGFQNPHDVAVEAGGDVVYEVELKQPYRVWKLASEEKGGAEDKDDKPKSLLETLWGYIGRRR